MKKMYDPDIITLARKKCKLCKYHTIPDIVHRIQEFINKDLETKYVP